MTVRAQRWGVKASRCNKELQSKPVKITGYCAHVKSPPIMKRTSSPRVTLLQASACATKSFTRDGTLYSEEAGLSCGTHESKAINNI